MGRSQQWISAASALSFYFLLAEIVLVHPRGAQAQSLPKLSYLPNSDDGAPGNADPLEDAIAAPEKSSTNLKECGEKVHGAGECKRDAEPCHDNLKRECQCSVIGCMMF